MRPLKLSKMERHKACFTVRNTPVFRGYNPLRIRVRVVAEPDEDYHDSKLQTQDTASSGTLTIFLDNGGSVTIPAASVTLPRCNISRDSATFHTKYWKEPEFLEEDPEIPFTHSNHDTMIKVARISTESPSSSEHSEVHSRHESIMSTSEEHREATSSTRGTGVLDSQNTSALHEATYTTVSSQSRFLTNTAATSHLETHSQSLSHSTPSTHSPRESEVQNGLTPQHLESNNNLKVDSIPQEVSQQGNQHAQSVQQHPEMFGIPQPILVISMVSAALTMSSCVFNTLLPIYMVTELKMTMRSMGVFEGLMEAFSYIVRMFSGVVSDVMTSRKTAITLGFAMGAAAKFGMSGASEVSSLFAAKVVDRLANGVQAAPRDALISDLAPVASRGSCFGFAQSFRKWGSAVGAIMSFFLMKASGNNYQLIFLMAASVSLASCLAFVLLVPNHVRPVQKVPEEASQKVGQQPAAAQGFSLSKVWKDVMSMGSDFYRMLVVVGLYCSAHINESLLEARAIEVGFGKAESTLVIACLSMAVFIAAWPLGRLDDKYGPRVTFAVGMLAHIAADAILMLSGHYPWAVFASLAFMGVHMGVMNGPLLGIAVSKAPAHLRGTAFGIFYTVMAVIAMSANSFFGCLWHTFGAPTAFGTSAALTVATLIALPWLLPSQEQKTSQQQVQTA